MFTLLSASRGAGMEGPRPIPMSEIEAYCRVYGLTGLEERDDLTWMVRAIDQVYLDLCEQRRKRTAKSTG